MANKAELADHLLSKARRHDVALLAGDLPLPDYPVVYVVGWATGPVKIGFARSVKDRIASLQTGCPYELRLLAYIGGGVETERLLHRHFYLDHLRAEWFDRSPAVVRFIQSLQAEHAKAAGLKLARYVVDRTEWEIA